MTTFVGNPGPNLFIGTTADDTFYFGLGDDSGFGGAGNDVAYLGPGNDQFSGGGGNDIIHTGGNQDIVSGDAGNDVLHVDGGTATFTGGTGADTLIYHMRAISSAPNAGGFSFLDFKPIVQHDHIVFDLARPDQLIKYDQATGTFFADLDGAAGPLGWQVAGRVSEHLGLVEGRDWHAEYNGHVMTTLHPDLLA